MSSSQKLASAGPPSSVPRESAAKDSEIYHPVYTSGKSPWSKEEEEELARAIKELPEAEFGSSLERCCKIASRLPCKTALDVAARLSVALKSASEH